MILRKFEIKEAFFYKTKNGSYAGNGTIAISERKVIK